jgi:hypothetical protein
MSIFDYAMPPIQTILAYGVPGLVCTLIGRHLWKSGRVNKLRANVVCGALVCFLSSLLTLSPILSRVVHINFYAMASLLAGVLGTVLYVFTVIAIFRGARDNRPVRLLYKAIGAIGIGLVIIPFMAGTHSETVQTILNVFSS